MDDAKFRKIILDYWRRHGRHNLPWRRTGRPYRILVSEIMLQQTQVPRVIDKYSEFLRAFPTFRVLANATVAETVKVWQGLGYNRRALQLRGCAQAVMRKHGGRLPRTYESLLSLPGIGPYTAGAVMAFAYNKPQPLIETNIRRVYLHHYFRGKSPVDDTLLRPLIARHAAQVRSARQWYSALMDYGSFLSGMVENPNRRSRQYVRQSPFEGSLRQLRGKILHYLTQYGTVNRSKLASVLNDSRLTGALSSLEREGFVQMDGVLVHMVS